MGEVVPYSAFRNPSSEFTAPGWERDESGALRRVKKPHMGHRLPGERLWRAIA